jgi:tryptophan synthase beta chain
MYDFGDTVGMTPLIPMYTLGHQFVPPAIHAGGLRYHGAGAIVSQLLKDGLIEAVAVPQLETFAAAVKFARTEGLVAAPETAHAIAQVIREAEMAKKEGKSRTILFNFSGHGHFDLAAYEQYLAGRLSDFELSESDIGRSLEPVMAMQ